ncbi:MAG: PilZ domain-containing protein [Thermodesulfobacteriota bacterium]
MQNDWGAGEKPVRREFRVPVDDKDGIRLIVGAREYEIRNLVPNGVQVVYEVENEFETNMELNGAELIVGERKIEVRAKVVYTSRLEPGRFSCGLYFLTINDEDVQFLRKLVAQKRKLLFSDV